MGTSSSLLTQYDIEDVESHVGGKYKHREIVALYDRFCALDKNGKGYITAEEFLSIPEFALNPLANRLLRMLESVNFKDFVSILSAFSPSATPEDKARFLFKVFDIDGKGSINRKDIIDVLTDLSVSSLTDEHREKTVTKALEEAGFDKDSNLQFSDLADILGSIAKLDVEIPIN